jgi:SOS-response transcriptional repressor LexA
MELNELIKIRRRELGLTLQAYNPEYPPKSFSPKDERVTILGVVREIRRSIAIP